VSQSPINLPLTARSDNINFAVAAPAMSLSSSWNNVNNEPWTEQGSPVNFHSFEAEGGLLSFTDPQNITHTGSLESFSVRAPSEHHFDGASRDVEVQFKHSSNIMLAVTFVGEELYSDDDDAGLLPAFHGLFDSIMSGDY